MTNATHIDSKTIYIIYTYRIYYIQGKTLLVNFCETHSVTLNVTVYVVMIHCSRLSRTFASTMQRIKEQESDVKTSEPFTPLSHNSIPSCIKYLIENSRNSRPAMIQLTTVYKRKHPQQFPEESLFSTTTIRKQIRCLRRSKYLHTYQRVAASIRVSWKHRSRATARKQVNTFAYFILISPKQSLSRRYSPRLDHLVILRLPDI